MPKNLLTDMEIEKVSLVAKGANKKSFFLFKSEQGEETAVSDENKEAKVADAEVVKEVVDTPDNTATEELLKEVESLKKRAEQAEENLKKANELAEAEREVRIQKEYVEKASAFKHVPMETDKLANILRKSGDLEEDLTELLKSVSKIVEESELLKETGTQKQSFSSDVSALRARAAEIQKELKINYSEALEKAIEENPEGYESHVNSLRNHPVRGER